MDTNTTLDEIRILIQRIQSGEQDLASELASKVQELDGWLSKGGFLPRVWRHQQIFSFR